MTVPSRFWALVMAVLVAGFLVLAGWRGVVLIRQDSAVAVALGVAVLILVMVGAWVLWRSWQFGVRTQEMARQLEAEGGLPTDELPRRPSGRADRAAADEVFARRRAETEQAPHDWRTWFRLSLAYDDAGDRRRAREAARTAIGLYRRR